MARKEWEDEEDKDEEDEDEEEYDLVAELRANIKDLIQERRKYNPTSNDYMILSQRIADETETLRNVEESEDHHAQKISAERNRYIGVMQIAGNVLGSFGGQLATALINRKNVKTVVGKEDEGELPMRSGATKFLK